MNAPEFSILALPDGRFKWFVAGASGIELTKELAYKKVLLAINDLLEVI